MHQRNVQGLVGACGEGAQHEHSPGLGATEKALVAAGQQPDRRVHPQPPGQTGPYPVWCCERGEKPCFLDEEACPNDCQKGVSQGMGLSGCYAGPTRTLNMLGSRKRMGCYLKDWSATGLAAVAAASDRCEGDLVGSKT